MVAITIEDSGIGMEQDFVDNHIFKPFAKANVHAVRLFDLPQPSLLLFRTKRRFPLTERSWSRSPTRVEDDRPYGGIDRIPKRGRIGHISQD